MAYPIPEQKLSLDASGNNLIATGSLTANGGLQADSLFGVTNTPLVIRPLHSGASPSNSQVWFTDVLHNNPILVIDAYNQLVGIGTDTPGSLLDVSGNINAPFITIGQTISVDTTTLTANQTNHNVGMGTASPNTSAKLDITSTTQGFLPPRMTTTQKNAISSPATGLLVYDTTIGDLQEYNGSAWVAIGSGFGVTSITGTANQVIASSSTGAVTLSLPQSIATTSNVQFGTLALGSSIVSSSILSLTSTTAGFLPPRMSGAQFTAIPSPATGLLVYDTDINYLVEYNGTTWTTVAPPTLAGGSTGSVQFNGGSGSFAGSTGFTFNSGTNVLTITQGGMILGNDSSITMYDAAIGSSNSIVLQNNPGGTITSYTLNLPRQQGAAHSLMANDGSGNLSFTTSPILTGLTLSGDLVSTATDATAIDLTSGGGITLTSAAGNGGNITLTAATPANGGNLYLAGSITGQGQVGIGTTTPNASASLDIESTTRGFLPPQMTSTQRNAIVSPANGLIVYDTTLNQLWEYQNGAWAAVGGTGTVTQNVYTVGTASGTYTGSTTLFNLPFTYVQDGKSLQVFYNGQMLVSGVDYAETSNTSVTFTNALTTGYEVTFRTYLAAPQSTNAVAQYANFVVGTVSGTYTGSTTVFNIPFAYTQDGKSLRVFYDGIQLVPGDDYTETSSTSITTTQALVSGQKIAFRTISAAGAAVAINHLRENYVVGTANGNYTGSTTVFNLINSYTPGGINLTVYLDGDLQTVGGSADYVETNSTTVTFNNALVSGQTVAFLFSQASVGVGGLVSSGTTGQLAVYGASNTVTSTTTPAAVASINNTFIGLGRNRILNGDMLFDQRHEGASVSTPFPRYIVDGLTQFTSTGSWTGQRLTTTPPTGFQNYMRYTVTTSGAVSSFNYMAFLVEGPYCRDFNFGTANAITLTVSFWARSSITGTFSGTLGNGTRSYAFIFSLPTANTWTYITQTIPGDVAGTWSVAAGSGGIALNFDLGSSNTYRISAGSWQSGSYLGVTGAVTLVTNTGATFDITGVQLEIGSQASSFEYLPYELALLRCQRYYEKTYDPGVAVGTATQNGAVYVPMAGASTNGVQYGSCQFTVTKCLASAPVTGYDINGVANDWLVRDNGGAINADGSFQATNVGTRNFQVRVISITGSPITASSSSNWYMGYGHFTVDAGI